MSISTSTADLNILTQTYFEADGGKAWDKYHQTSFAVTYFDKLKKGMFKVVKGGTYFEFPIVSGSVFSRAYGRQETSITRTSTSLTSPTRAGGYDNEILSSAKFPIRNIISSVKYLRMDKIQNAGAQARANLIKTRLDAALGIHGESMAKSLYWDYNYDTGGSHTHITDTEPVFEGALCCCLDYATSQTLLINGGCNFGGIASTSLGPWDGRRETDSSTMSFSLLRTLRNEAKVSQNKVGKPNFCVMPPSYFALLRNVAGTLIRLDTQEEAVKFGFTTLVHEGMMIDEDDFCPANTTILLNTEMWGLHFLEGGHHEKTDWTLVAGSPDDYYMDIYANGNWVTPCRRAHIAATNLTGA